MPAYDIWNIVLAVLASLGGGGAIVLGLSSYLGKFWAERILQGEAAKLRQEAFAFETRFGRLHEKQASIIAEMYEKINEFLDATNRYVHSTLRNTEALEQTFEKQSVELWLFHRKNRIYFPPQLAEALQDFIKKIRNPAITKMVYGDFDPTFDPMENAEDRRDRFKRVREAAIELEKISPVLLANLENEFRMILGVNSD